MVAERRDGRPGLRAVVLDYGEVLCHRPSSDEFSRMATTCGISLDAFVTHWEQSRPPYDRGDVTPEDYWSKLAADMQTNLDAKQVEQFRRWEVEMWTNINPVMVEWLVEMSAAGIKTGLLSNMHADLADHVQRNFEWMAKFTSKTFSAHVRLVKPDPAIYQHVLRDLNVEPSATVFVDDREINIQAARELGINAIQFQSIAQLRNDLETLGFPILPAAID